MSDSRARRGPITSVLRVLLYFMFGCVVLLSATHVSFGQTGQSPIPLPSPFTPIVDNANVIDAETENKLGSIYLNLKQRADIEFAVVTVDTIGGQTFLNTRWPSIEAGALDQKPTMAFCC